MTVSMIMSTTPVGFARPATQPMPSCVSHMYAERLIPVTSPSVTEGEAAPFTRKV